MSALLRAGPACSTASAGDRLSRRRPKIELHDLAAGAVPVIDRATLESAVARCQAGFGDEDSFPRRVDKAAALLHGIASTQCFQDGNL
ncbi:hypothetical protein [Blastococcus sp. LR1]|uniref:hypothetical protein n=1 Tax=Blastococcus sp. LR1 TaxID=2877000 RepID=UPI001CCC7AE6|nr:hypothetical protein [Blastococcus sp. LR1]MCA0143965.1 hypothetical protein [Blastococcus sp. LR1]